MRAFVLVAAAVGVAAQAHAAVPSYADKCWASGEGIAYSFFTEGPSGGREVAVVRDGMTCKIEPGMATTARFRADYMDCAWTHDTEVRAGVVEKAGVYTKAHTGIFLVPNAKGLMEMFIDRNGRATPQRQLVACD